LVSPFHCFHALNVNILPQSPGGAAAEDDSSLVCKERLLELTFGPEPVIKLIAWEAATLKTALRGFIFDTSVEANA